MDPKKISNMVVASFTAQAADGWVLATWGPDIRHEPFDRNTRGSPHIERYDRDRKFPSDMAASVHVLKRARAGSLVHKEAIDLIREHNWPEFLRIVVHSEDTP
jgi:hypothetical protein